MIPQKVRCYLVREDAPHWPAEAGEPLTLATDVAHIMATLYGNSPQEVMVAFHLDAQNRIVAIDEVTRGLATSTLTHPREIFRSAIINNASSVILSHNHPSGKADPSPEDEQVTRQMARAGKALGIPLIDHVVATHDPDACTSLANKHPHLFTGF